SPIAMVGLRAGENLFVGDDGRWSSDVYLPAYVARYPFILVRVDEQADYTVCLDETYEGFSEDEGEPLFDDEGKESELTQRVITVLRDLLTETERTRRFVERLKSLDLFTVRSARVQDRLGRWYGLEDFRVVDEKKLAELDDKVISALHRSGYLGCIYAHLFSLGNVARLGWRLPVEAATDAAHAPAAATSRAPSTYTARPRGPAPMDHTNERGAVRGASSPHPAPQSMIRPSDPSDRRTWRNVAVLFFAHAVLGSQLAIHIILGGLA